MKSDGYIDSFINAVQTRITFALILISSSAMALGWVLFTYTVLDETVILCATIAWIIITGLISSWLLSRSITKPTKYIAQAITHVTPSEQLSAAPNMDDLRLGKDLANSLARQVYDQASAQSTSANDSSVMSAAIFDQIPVAVLGIDPLGTIVTANSAALETLKTEKLAGESLDKFVTLNSETSITQWLAEMRESAVTANKTWQKVEVGTLNHHTLGYFDVSVNFSKHNSSGIETMIALHDHTEEYSDESSAISFTAMAVHELRTPVTILRGYIEAVTEDADTTNNPELAQHLKKMNASAQGLASFISNILNVAKINQDQLELNLAEGSWNIILPEVIDGLRNKAAVNGKNIELRMQPDMPTIAVDRLTAGEVVTNLIDNAIKYSPDNATQITVISKVSAEGLIETTVQDQGVGIPPSVMNSLFTKFSRNHRNQSTINGTGLGLYLCKTIITAHHGHIWANSKENEGSTFGFTLLPYTQLAKNDSNTNNEGIVHTSHGWIKNHSMQRR